MAVNITGRALHFVFKIGDRAKNAHFFKEILGMQVLRHEEFKEGCDAQCNGPYDDRWSKTMVGYGPESTHFVIELTYNYGIKSYALGNDFVGITIKSKDIIERARAKNYPISNEGDVSYLTSPDGFKFYIVEEEPVHGDPITEVALHVSDLEKSGKYWHDLLRLCVLEEDNDSLLLAYNPRQTALRLRRLTERLNRAESYGRIAFAVPKDQQPTIDAVIKQNKGTILTPLITLPTPGKASVRVIILADPDRHEICFVDEEGFGELSQVQPNAAQLLDKYISKDPFQDK